MFPHSVMVHSLVSHISTAESAMLINVSEPKHPQKYTHKAQSVDPGT